MNQNYSQSELQKLLIEYKKLYSNLVELEKLMDVIKEYLMEHPEEVKYINRNYPEMSGSVEMKIYKTYSDIEKAKECVFNIYKKLSENNLCELKDVGDIYKNYIF